MTTTSPADAAAPALRKAADLRELARLFTKYYVEDFGTLIETVDHARRAGERAEDERLKKGA